MLAGVRREAWMTRAMVTTGEVERVVERTGVTYPCRGSASAVVGEGCSVVHPNSRGTGRYFGASGMHVPVPGAARRSTGGAFGRFTSAQES